MCKKGGKDLLLSAKHFPQTFNCTHCQRKMIQPPFIESHGSVELATLELKGTSLKMNGSSSGIEYGTSLHFLKIFTRSVLDSSMKENFNVLHLKAHISSTSGRSLYSWPPPSFSRHCLFPQRMFPDTREE